MLMKARCAETMVGGGRVYCRGELRGVEGGCRGGGGGAGPGLRGDPATRRAAAGVWARGLDRLRSIGLWKIQGSNKISVIFH